MQVYGYYANILKEIETATLYFLSMYLEIRSFSTLCKNNCGSEGLVVYRIDNIYHSVISFSRFRITSIIYFYSRAHNIGSIMINILFENVFNLLLFSLL